MELIQPPEIRANGHYAPAVKVGNLLFISGQLPMRDGKLVAGGIREQTGQALENVDRILKAAGLKRQNVAMCHVYLSNVDDWNDANDVYAAFFGTHKPARVIVPTRELHFGALVEIEAMAEQPFGVL